MRPTHLLCTLALLTAADAPPPRRVSSPQPLPTERLIGNLEAMLRRDADDHQVHFRLARVHYLALANQLALLPAYPTPGGGHLPATTDFVGRYLQSLRWEEARRRARSSLGVDASREPDRVTREKLDAVTHTELRKLVAEGWKPGLDEKTLRQHAEDAMAHFQRAIRLAPERSRYHLGRASVAEQVLDLDGKGELRRRRLKGYRELTYGAVCDWYYEAYRLACAEGALTTKMAWEGTPRAVALEAATGYLRLLDRDEKLRSEHDNRIGEVRKTRSELETGHHGVISPVVFGDRADQRLSGLLDPSRTVEFDLDGDGVGEDWPWVKGSTHFLVWDPDGAGDIRSGRQLFGSVTWFVFHRDGYAALGLLDDDGNGRLTGWELDGLGVWTDRNADGRSTVAEVQPLWQWGVTAVGLAAARDENGVLGAPMGLQFEDGRVLPTFDWETERR